MSATRNEQDLTALIAMLQPNGASKSEEENQNEFAVPFTRKRESKALAKDQISKGK